MTNDMFSWEHVNIPDYSAIPVSTFDCSNIGSESETAESVIWQEEIKGQTE